MVYEVVAQLLSDSLVCDPEQITASSGLQTDLGLGEDDVVEILQAVADEFSFSWSTRDVEEIATVGDLVSYIEGRL